MQMLSRPMLIAAALLLSSESYATPKSTSVATSTAVSTSALTATGFVQLGIGDVVGPSHAFLNAMTNWGFNVISTLKTRFPAYLSENGLPSAPIPDDINGDIVFPTYASGYLGKWQISWTGTGAFRLPYGSSGTPAAISIISCTGSCRQTTSTTTVSGTNASMTFVFGSVHAQINQAAFPTGFSYSGMSNMRFCRYGNASPDDCSRLANGEYINQDFINAVAPLHPRTIRTMDWSGANIGNLNYSTKRSYNAGPSSIGWLSPRWAGPKIWAGTISGTDAYSSPTFADAPAAWPPFRATSSVVAWQGVFQNTNTSATPTISVTGIAGAKTIVNTGGAALAAGDIKTDRPSTLIYDPVLDKVLYAARGMAITVPIEAQVALANALNANLWFNFSGMVDDDSVTSYVTYARNNLKTGLVLYTEYMNEVWNFALGPMTSWTAARGAVLGFPIGNNERVYGPHGLRTWQINSLAAAAWSPRASAQLRRVIANQSSTGTAAIQQKWRLNGADLNSSMYPTYGRYTGNADHNAYPNRPIDNSDVLSYATYFYGAILGQGTFGPAWGYAAQDLADCSQPGTNSGGLVCAVKNYVLGTPQSRDAAYAWVDNDVRRGTKNGRALSATLAALACNGTGTCNTAANPNTYVTWEHIAAGYDSGRSVPLKIELYEGGWSSTNPTASDCTAMGIDVVLGGASVCATTIQSLLAGYKTSSYALGIVSDQFNQFMGRDPSQPTYRLLSHSVTPSWYQFQGPITQVSPWPLIQSSVYGGPYINFYPGFRNFQ